MNTIAWNLTGYYALGSALCILAQLILLLILLARRRREKREIRLLRASERMYRSLTEHTEDVIARLAADGRILYVSPACQDIFGYAPDDVLEQDANLFVHPDDIEQTWDAVYKAEASGSGHYSAQSRIRHKQGHWMWAEIKGRLLYDHRGERAEMHCLIRDLADRKQAEDTLRASEEKFRALFGLLPVGISVSSFQEGRFSEANEAFLQALGYRRDELIGKTSPELNLWVDPAGRAQFLEPLQQHGSVRDLEIAIRAKSGAVLNTLFSCEKVDIDGQQCLIAAFMDITGRKRNEEALRESEIKFRTIFENVPLSMSITRIDDGTYLDVNRKFVESTGFSKSEICGKAWSEGFPHILEEPDSGPSRPAGQLQDMRRHRDYLDQAAFGEMEQEFQARGKLENFYFRSRAENGGPLHHLMSVYPVVLQGEACALSIMTDITDLKKAEEELREREEKYRVLFENMAQGAMYQLADGRVDDVNAAALAIFDVSYEEFIAQTSQEKPLWKVMHEDGSELSIEQWPAIIALTTGLPVRNVTLGVDLPPKPARIWVTVTAIPLFKSGETRPYRVFTTFHDVTALKRVEQELRAYQEHLEELVTQRMLELQREIEARKQSEQCLREREEKYRLIAENASDVIWTENAAHQLTYISPSIQQLLGYTPEELLQGRHKPLFTAESEKMVADLIAHRRPDDRDPARLEVEQIRKDDSTVWVEVIVKRLYDALGQLIGFLGISRNIGVRKQSEQALRQATDAALEAQRAAESANRAKSMFLSSMSHELRTPLNAILGFAQLLARETTLSPVQKEYLGTINRSGEHLLQLINDVLDMSKIEAERMAMNRSSFDLRQMLDDIEDMMRVRAEQKGLELRVAYPPDLPRDIITDEKKLRQILINVLGNAVKFTEYGMVSLKVAEFHEVKQLPHAPTPETHPFVNAATPEFANSGTPATRQLYFEISDTGPGIAPEDLAAIFEAFRQTGRAQNHEGTGLGLAISRKCAQLLGGDIQVQSTVGRGSQFSVHIQVELPAHERLTPAPPIRTISGLAAAPSLPVRILVADDHTESRRLINELLGTVGFVIEEAANGEDAVRMAEHWSPHLILMDMRMPVLDGYDATRAIRQLEITQSKTPIPIIALTASVFEEEQQHILAAGCDMLLRKPISAPELFEAIRSYLGIEYVYAEDERLLDTRHSKGTGNALTPDALAALPEAVIERLKQAVISGNQALMADAVAEIRAQNAELADSLAHLMHNFKYQAIWEMIQPLKPTGRIDL